MSDADAVYVVVTGETRNAHEDVQGVYGSESVAQNNAYMEIRPDLRERARLACRDPLENGPVFAFPDEIEGFYVDVYEAPFYPGGGVDA